jgi:hypothetical protein
VHEHFDANGVLTGTTVVTRESVWDDTSRERALALTAYEAGTCKCGCGQPIERAYDKKQAYTVHHFTCQAGRAIDLVRHREAEEADRLNKPDGWNAGRHYYVEPVEADNG